MSATDKDTKKRRQLPLWQETILMLVVATALAVLIKAFFVQAFYIPSESMEPQFVRLDRILVQKVSYWNDTPDRGDIVVFKDPGGWLPPQPQSTGVKRALELIGLYPTGGHLVKRVIGVGGDRVKCCDNSGRLSVNGQALTEPYLPKGTPPSSQEFDIKVPAGHIWVMGDNRGNSADSRAHMGLPGGGFIDTHQVVGKVFALVWPLSRAEWISNPSTFDRVPASP
ncbi:MAG TPA: signal peptidase I [Marmoricola sp.]|nr:signal peptidase I [Marmoricola sp.]